MEFFDCIVAGGGMLAQKPLTLAVLGLNVLLVKRQSRQTGPSFL